jgi:hypothetical protein
VSTFNFTSTNPLGNYALKIGNSKSYPMRALRADQATPINLAGASFKRTLRALPLESEAVLVTTFGTAYPNPDPTLITIVDASTGDFKLNYRPADTSGMAPRTIKHDLEITEADGTVSTILEGDIELADHAARGN